MNPADVLSVPERFALILRGVMSVLAARMVVRPVMPALMVVYRRLQRMVQLLERIRAGVPFVVRDRSGERSARTAPGLPGLPGLRVSARFGWLVLAMPDGTRLRWNLNAYRAQLEALLQDPEVAALVRSRPGLARAVRPLCRMLLIVPVAAVAVARRVVRVAPVWASTGEAGVGELRVVPPAGLSILRG